MSTIEVSVPEVCTEVCETEEHPYLGEIRSYLADELTGNPRYKSLRLNERDLEAIVSAVFSPNLPGNYGERAPLIYKRIRRALNQRLRLQKGKEAPKTNTANRERKRRQGRGGEDSVDRFAKSPYEQDVQLTLKALYNNSSPNSESAQRSRQMAFDQVEHLKAQLSPANQILLTELSGNVVPGESLNENAREIDSDHTQLSRLRAEAREILTHTSRRLKRQSAIKREPLVDRWPRPGVPHEVYMQPHMGVVLPSETKDKRSSPGRDVPLDEWQEIQAEIKAREASES